MTRRHALFRHPESAKRDEGSQNAPHMPQAAHPEILRRAAPAQDDERVVSACAKSQTTDN
jgi:hypothetical protein